MKFLIVNMLSFRNKGCEAFTKGIIDELSKLNRTAEFKIFTYDPFYDQLFLNNRENVSFLLEPFGFSPALHSKWWYFRLAASLRVSDRIRNGIKAFSWADAVVSTDDVFSSTYGGLYKCLASVQVSSSLNKPTILIGQSIGPFDKKREYKSFVKAAKNVKLITARESITLDYVKGMHLKNTRLELTADPAFCLEPDLRNTDKIMNSNGIKEQNILIGIAPSQAMACFGNISALNHLEALKGLISFLLASYNCKILLIPHVEDRTIGNNDRVLCEQLFRELGFPEKVKVLNMNYSAEEIRSIVGRLDIMIAERMHAAVASLAENVPTLIISYSAKSKGIFSDIFGSSNVDRFLLPIRDLTEETFKKKVSNLLDNRDAIREQLLRVIPQVKEKSKLNFTLLLEELVNC